MLLLTLALAPPRAGALPLPGEGILLSPQANQLDLYDLDEMVPGATRTTPIPSHQHDPGSEPGEDPVGHGNDVNGQICRITQADGKRYYIMGEDSDQGQLPRGVAQGWGIFEPTNGAAGPWTLVDKLVPTYDFTDPPNTHLPDNTGCAVSADGSILFTVDLGEGAFPAGEFGSLFAFYRDALGDFSSSSPYCVLDDDITTGGYIAVDPATGDVLVPQSGRIDGGFVERYTAYPSTASECDSVAVTHQHFISDLPSYVPISIAHRNGKWLVGNVVPGQISEYDDDGNLVRPVVVGQGPGVAGLAVDGAGNLYFANLGLVPCDTILCPADGAGSVSKVSFAPVTDAPLPAVVLMAGLTYPEGLGAFAAL